MPSSPFEAAVREHDGLSIIDLRGDITADATAALDAAWRTVASARPERVMLDFTAVDYINSTGIAVIVGLLARARDGHIAVHACGLNEHYREIFTITRLSEFMTIAPDEAGAQGGVAPAGA